MIFIVLITLYPVWHVVMASFSETSKLYVHSGTILWPLGKPSTEAYEMVFKHRLILSGFKNTLFVLVVGVIVNLIFTMLGAFFMSVKGPMFSNVFGYMVIISMYFNGGMVPTYLNIVDLGLLDSRWALIFPVAITTSNMIIMKSAFVAVPSSLVESALLDGANYGQVLVRVMAPLCKATIAVLVLYYGVSHWNSWFSASIYLRDANKYPVQLVMRNILSTLTSGVGGVEADEAALVAQQMQYALIVVVSLPVMVIYPFIQKYFVKGVMIGAVKG
ncbi:MAG: carbohydrate ABC transporter permease [Lachnospiraceae bacterium]|nr:carbohydrate ABC transporter permease [Lachnospiraceae bacterium]